MTTEAEAIAELVREAQTAGAPVPMTITDHEDALVVTALPQGWTQRVIDMERHAQAPRRNRGTTKVHDAASLVAAVERRRLPITSPMVYADEDNLALVAILNDDEADVTGWRDYRVELDLRQTAEWRHWRGKDGRLMGQESFAEHIEDGALELRDPPPAEMLELAQHFHVTVNARARSGNRLADGRIQVVYEEDVDASAGQGGTITIPETLTLAVRPFVGGDLYEVRARFRYRLPRGGGELQLGYKLDRPDDIERAAFGDVRARVEEGLPDAGMIAGPAPEPTPAGPVPSDHEAR